MASIQHLGVRQTAAAGLTAALASDAVLDGAFAWVCRRRRDWPADADIWSFRRDWRDERQRLKAALLSGRFRFGLLQRVTKADGSEADLWSARDALVLKALTLVLGAGAAGLAALHPHQRQRRRAPATIFACGSVSKARCPFYAELKALGAEERQIDAQIIDLEAKQRAEAVACLGSRFP